MVVEFNMVRTIGFAVVLLLFGRWLRGKVKFFRTFAIPAPVIGGFSFAIVNLIFRLTGFMEINFDTTLQSFFMIIFFTSIGFGASIKILKAAGPKVLIFLVVAGVLCVLQNALALGLAPIVGIDKGLALMTGSTPMTGGHGTSAGIAPLVEAAGITSAETVAYSSATFGLVMGSLMGGPLANRLILKNDLIAKRKHEEEMDVDDSLIKADAKMLDGDLIFRAFCIILVAMFLGTYISDFLNSIIARFTDMAKLPAYIGPMILGILARYFSDNGSGFVPVEEVEIVGNVGLNFFLGMALMTLKLWELIDLAIPLIILLLAQTVLMAIYANFVTFKVMGSNYDAAVLAAGHCGFGMGATPNGVANMESVCEKFEYSRVAFFVLPIVGGMFIDFVNVFVIIVSLAFI